MNDREEFEFELPATYGDLVTVDGYEGRLFMVIAYQLIRYCTPEEEYNETVYEVLDAHDGEYLEADGEDVEFVTDASQADEYVRAYRPAPKNVRPEYLNFMFGNGGEVMAKQERKPTARELSAREAEERKKARAEREDKVNTLLEIRKWNERMLEKTNNEDYGDSIFAIDAELKKLTDVEK